MHRWPFASNPASAFSVEVTQTALENLTESAIEQAIAPHRKSWADHEQLPMTLLCSAFRF
jgi:hypothetical protein